MSAATPPGVPQPTPEAIAEATAPLRPQESTIALAVCEDCAVWIANHDGSGIENLRHFTERFAWYTRGLRFLVVDSSEDACDGWFSWQHCDTCGAIAGQRYAASAEAG